MTGGTYFRTNYPDANGRPTGLADPATVSSFRLDKYEVTVGRFRQFVNAWSGGAGWTPAQGSGKHTHLNSGKGLIATGGGYEPGWLVSDNSNVAPTTTRLAACPYATWTASAGSQENLPITCPDWYEAYAFCIWDGGFLPSDAEWEYAATGGSQQRPYPWGLAGPGTASQYAICNCDYPNGPADGPGSGGVGSGVCVGVTNIASVGTAPQGAGLWGQLDLAGNVWEWNLDFYSSYVNPCTDCANLTPTTARVIRGGDFSDGAPSLLPSTSRNVGAPSGSNGRFGFRCARTP